tara:strand:- start:3054 stop:4469 length:1416 start_codon:yes stop_codon:yes gene_type:complete
VFFNSLEFLIFFTIFFLIYWGLAYRRLDYQNSLILFGSYFFYGWWDYRFLSLIVFSTAVDFFVGLNIPRQNSEAKKKSLLWLSIIFNLGVLGFFKYYNFFVDSLIDSLSILNYTLKSVWTLKIILPVGISFYTFQTLSYTIDIYKKKLEPTKDFISFASFVSFFPQLVAGPIERASNLLPQILNIRKFKYEQGVQGLRLILWGLFKKIVIADSLASKVDYIFSNYQVLEGGTLWIGAIYFSFQIYCDFSGYSDIAIGVSKLLGFELSSNFKFPYFSRNIAEFWRRWHISLSTWFRDYIYIPLGGSKVTFWLALRNIFIIFLISGFWHGANYTFIVWGGIHAFLYIPTFIFKTNRKYRLNSARITSLKDLTNIIITFLFVTIAWVFFRSESLADAFAYLTKLFSNITFPSSNRQGLLYVFIFIGLELLFKNDERNLLNFNSKALRYFTYISLCILILTHSFETNQSFIYFNF